MSSTWRAEIGAVLAKEARTELRGRTGLVTGGLFGLATVVTIALALFDKDPNEPVLRDVSASLIWTVLVFASLLSLPRAFLAEEERGTADLLRLTARPHAVFWGKALFNLALTLVLGGIVAALFLGLTGMMLRSPGLFLLALIGGVGALAGAVTLCGAIAAGAENRAALAGAIALPLVLAPTQWGVSAMRSAFGAGEPAPGQIAAGGLIAYAVLTLALGPWIYAAIWKR